MFMFCDKCATYLKSSIVCRDIKRLRTIAVIEQPICVCKNNNSKINCELAIGQHLVANQNAPKHVQTIPFGLLGKQDRPLI